MHLERFSANGNIFVLRKRPVFSIHAKPSDKEKPFACTAKLQFPTAPKLTCNHKFHPRNPTVSLQYNIPFSKLRNLASAVWLPFRTDSNPHRRYPGRLQCPVRPVTWWWPVISAEISYRAEIWIEVAGRSPACFLVTFCTVQKVTSRSLCRELRVFPNLDSAHPNIKYTLTKLNPLKESSEVLPTSNQHTQPTPSHKPN